jgi:hypothetical protein
MKRLLLADSCDEAQSYVNWHQAMYMAASTGNSQIMDFLLREPKLQPCREYRHIRFHPDIQIPQPFKESLDIASSQGHYDIVSKLLQRPELDDEARHINQRHQASMSTALVNAAKKSHTVVIHKLLKDKRTDLGTIDLALLAATKANQLKAVRLLSRHATEGGVWRALVSYVELSPNLNPRIGAILRSHST